MCDQPHIAERGRAGERGGRTLFDEEGDGVAEAEEAAQAHGCVQRLIAPTHTHTKISPHTSHTSPAPTKTRTAITHTWPGQRSGGEGTSCSLTPCTLAK